MSNGLVVNEIFLSLQGESSFAGWPCIFVRLTGCNLRCAWCDTAYAFTEGRRMGIEDIWREIQERAGRYTRGDGRHRLPLVEVTGGEPLLQAGSLGLMKKLCDEGFTVLLETSGALDISPVDPRVHRIMDLKCPGSGEEGSNRWENLRHLKAGDEIKFVVASQEDYQWAKRQLEEHRLASLCPILVSWAESQPPNRRDPALKPPPAHHHPITRRQLAEQIMADALPVRFQVQMHKIIWPEETRGV